MKLDFTNSEVFSSWATQHVPNDGFIRQYVSNFIEHTQPQLITIIHNIDVRLTHILRAEFITEFRGERTCVRVLRYLSTDIALIFIHDTEPHYSEYVYTHGTWLECSLRTL